MRIEENPLLADGFDIPFDRIEAAHVEPAMDALIAQARDALDAVAQGSAPHSYESTLAAMERATERLERAMAVVGHLESVATDDALREAYNAVRPKVTELYVSIPLDARLYRVLKEFAESNPHLSPTQQRFLDKTLRDFRRHGAELSENGKAELREIDVELAKLTTRFGQNLLDETKDFELYVEDEAELAGLPDRARSAARARAQERGRAGFRFNLQAPSIRAVLTYADDAKLRRTLWHAYNTRASQGERSNRGLILEILQLRQKKARLLGYDDFADFVLEERMAKTGAKARGFVEQLRARTEGGFAEENRMLVDFKRDTTGEASLGPSDVGYWSEKQRRARYDFDEEELRPYFGVDRVLEGLFAVASRLYGVDIVERTDAPTWHPSVRTFALKDQARTLGCFYVDLYPRDNKRGGAWMNSLITGGPQTEGEFNPHLGLFCANVTPPLEGAPALLAHSEVETLFHEFGHLLHHCLSEVDVRSLAGTAVAWDFVELPSQIMENWVWEKEALDLFARHYETNEVIPPALFEKMQRARTYRAANAMMRQLGFATADLTLHTEFDPETGADPVELAREVMERFSPTPLPEDYAMICGFSHLFSSPVGYAAGYYSYKWAEVLDADAFSRFQREGIFNREVGRAFRELILARGDSAEPEALFRDFMGREPSMDALLSRSGLSSM